MNNDSKFWLSFWALVSTVFVVLILSAAYYNTSELDTLSELVSSGASPIEASCAISYKNSPVCTVEVLRGE